MNHFDDEEKIIRLFQSINRNRILFANFSLGLSSFFNCIYREEMFKGWINSAAKDAMPPDFFSTKYKCMLEVMRVDDHVDDHNSPNALENKVVKQLENMLRAGGISSMKEANIELFYIPDKSKASPNNYKTYVENFRRIVTKHLEKIDKYRSNHPRYKLGFLVFDETPAYIKALQPNDGMRVGEMIQGEPHILFRDKNLMEIFEGKNLDYLIWLTPNKCNDMNPNLYPSTIVIDCKKWQRADRNWIEYKYEEMQCLEVR